LCQLLGIPIDILGMASEIRQSRDTVAYRHLVDAITDSIHNT
jgi:hypothetical protein